MAQLISTTGAKALEGVKFPTTIGCGALLVWALYALVISELVLNLPVFEISFFVFSTSFIAMIVRLVIRNNWSILKDQPWWIWVVGILGTCGSDLAYITAVKYAPPAHVDFIDYLWPFFVILCTAFLPKERFTLKHLLAASLGLAGVFMLITGGEGLIGFKMDYFVGYMFALTAAIIWCTYTIVLRFCSKTPMEMIGMYSGVGALVSLMMHFKFESFVVPSPRESILAIFLGLSSGMAYLLWSYGTQKGNLKLLGVLAYFTPVISMGLLVLCDKEPMSIALVFACIMVVSGVIVGGLDWSFLRAKSRAKKAKQY